MSRLGRRRVVTKWLTSTPESRRADLEGWLDDLFYRALAWVVGARAFVVETTLVGTVTNGLSALIGAESRAGFVTGLVRGLGGNLGLADRAAFAKEVFAWAGERPPDAGAPLDCDVDPGTGALYGFSSRCGGVAGGRSDGEGLSLDSVIETVSTQRAMRCLAPWVERAEPFLLVVRRVRALHPGVPRPPRQS